MLILFRRLQSATPKLVLLCGIALSLSLGVVACGGSSSSSNGNGGGPGGSGGGPGGNGSDPTLAITDIPNQELVIGTSLTLNVAVTGGTGTTSYSVSSTPASEATFTIDQATDQLTINASGASEATVEVTVTVEKGSETASETFQLSIVPELTISVDDQELAARDRLSIPVTSGGLSDDTVTYSVTESSLADIEIDDNGLLTIDASGVGVRAAAVPVMVSAMNDRTTVTDSFMLTITPPVLTIELNDADGNQVSECDIAEGNIGSTHAIEITGPPSGKMLHWRIEDSGGIMDDDVRNIFASSFGDVGEVISGLFSLIGVRIIYRFTFHICDDSTPNPAGRTLIISILPSLADDYQLPTTPGMGYTIGTGGNVQVVCSVVDPLSPPPPPPFTSLACSE